MFLNYRFEILYSIIAILSLWVIALFLKKLIHKFSALKSIEKNRRKVIIKLMQFLFYLIALILLSIVWGVDLKQFTIFISSILAILGVGFFAQWSILSNITASIILFFYHPVRIGDNIKILDKDFDWTGEVKDITGFFLYMKTNKGENITLPTTLVLQKGIQILEKKSAGNK